MRHFLDQADLHHNRLQLVQHSVHTRHIVWPVRYRMFLSPPLLAVVLVRVESEAYDLSLAHWVVPGTVYCQNLTAHSNKENKQLQYLLSLF